MNFFKKATGESQLGQALICSLDDRFEFDNFEHLSKSLSGEIVEVERFGSGSKYGYLSQVSAMKVESDGVSNSFMSTGELSAILEKRDVVLCRFFTSAYSFGSYYSNAMKIPARIFLRVVNLNQARIP